MNLYAGRNVKADVMLHVVGENANQAITRTSIKRSVHDIGNNGPNRSNEYARNSISNSNKLKCQE